MAISPFLSALAGSTASLPPGWIIDPDTGEAYNPNGVTVTANRQVPIAEQGAPTTIAQPEWADLPAPERDPLAVNPNDPVLLDRRNMLFQAQEAQRAAAAKAAGQEYEPREQKGGEFKASPGSQLGLTGVGRDIFGGVTDFLGMLIGRRPRYAESKWKDAIYGWDQPGGLEAAIHRGMQTDPERTMEFYKTIAGVKGQQEQTASMAGYRQEQANRLLMQRLGGLGSAILSSGNPEESWNRNRRAIQAIADQALGPGTYEVPENYSEAAARELSRIGYGPGETQRESAAILSNETKRDLAAAKNALDLKKAQMSSSDRRYVANIMAETSRGNARAALELRRWLDENRLIETGRDIDLVSGSSERRYDTVGNVRQGRRVKGPDGRMYIQRPDGSIVPAQ